MNYTQPGSEIRQSDEILRKLNQIKHAIEDNRDPSPDNLHEYLPKERINSNQFSKPRSNDISNPQSYRHSLEKKLQRLFKQERKVFNQKQEHSQISPQSLRNGQPFPKYDSKDAFTVQRMQNKIKELVRFSNTQERKYLSSSHVSQQKMKPNPKKQADYSFQNNKGAKQTRLINIQEEENQTPKKKTKSIYEKPAHIREKQPERTNKYIKIQDKSDRKLLTQLDSLKKEIREIKESNFELNQKIQLKQHERRNKKQRSRYLLRCILAKLMQMQEEVCRREKKQEKKPGRQTPQKGSIQQRQSLIHENSVLIRQVEQLNKNLKKQIAEKERAQQRSNWIENQLRKLNRI